MRGLAEFTCRTGDLYATHLGRPVEPDEGIDAQRRAQAPLLAADPDYRREVALRLEFEALGSARTLSGRADGLAVTDGALLVDEFKCVGLLPHAADPVDMGQALIYAGLLAVSEADTRTIRARVIYVEADTDRQRVFEKVLSAAAARATLGFLLLCWEARLERHQRRVVGRLDWAERADFPYGEYRAGQRAIARRVYVALRDRENLLLEAPTGSGKTLAVLYPTLKALAADEQAFFLTSRNLGAQAAMQALRLIDDTPGKVSVVSLTAKEKICPVEGTPCDPELCRYAAGYFDRIGAAVDEALALGHLQREDIERIAQAHVVCPFELSLDVATWADVIVGDYNYMLDPIVRLLRFAEHDGLHLLIDEAHQLAPRTSEMLAVAIDRSMLKAAASVRPAALAKRVKSIDRALLKLRRDAPEGESLVADIASLERAIARLLDEVGGQDLDLADEPAFREVLFACSRWRRSDAWYTKEHFHHRLVKAGRDVEVARVCLDPSPYLQERLSAHAGVVRFSATLTPATLYQRLHGQDDEPAERVASPFDPANAAVFVVPDVPTYYRQREATLPRLRELIREIVTASTGRYLVAFPSYAYLDLLCDDPIAPGVEQFVQTPRQDAEAAKALLKAYGASEHAVLGIVMGGIFGESVDFTGISLKGVIAIGIGLPPPSLDRDARRTYFDERLGVGWGQTAAYLQPALAKIVQAAGRLIRDDDDCGIICLVDPRFKRADVQRFFPQHWRTQIVPAAQIGNQVARFWSGNHHARDPALPMTT